MEDNVPQYILAFPEETETGQAVTITETDISNLIRSKGAVFAATKSLIDYVGLSFEQLDTIYLAGGFGSSLNIPKAIAIGLLPDINPQKIQFIGNSCIMGARMALLSRPAFESAISISKKMTNIELSKYSPFMNEYIAALFLPHTHGVALPFGALLRCLPEVPSQSLFKTSHLAKMNHVDHSGHYVVLPGLQNKFSEITFSHFVHVFYRRPEMTVNL